MYIKTSHVAAEVSISFFLSFLNSLKLQLDRECHCSYVTIIEDYSLFAVNCNTMEPDRKATFSGTKWLHRGMPIKDKAFVEVNFSGF